MANESAIPKGWIEVEPGHYCHPSLAKANRVANPPVVQRSVEHEPLGKAERTSLYPGCVSICITSYRFRLLDERNLWDKWIVDGLVYAGIIRDDSPQWAKVQVEQVKVDNRAEERTEITITALWHPKTR